MALNAIQSAPFLKTNPNLNKQCPRSTTRNPAKCSIKGRWRGALKMALNVGSIDLDAGGGNEIDE